MKIGDFVSSTRTIAPHNAKEALWDLSRMQSTGKVLQMFEI
jgi:hypothetical protein